MWNPSIPSGMDNGLFKARRVAVPLHYSMINQFMYLWIKWNRPCDLRIQRSERDKETVGICFNVENNDTVDLMHDLKSQLRVDIYDLKA